MRGQPWSKSDARLLKWAKRGTFVSLFGYACLMTGALLATGCATSAYQVDAPNASGLSSYNNHQRYDDSVVAYCEELSLEVAFGLVSQNPEAFTVESVTEMVGYFYQNCIRDNGRGA